MSEKSKTDWTLVQRKDQVIVELRESDVTMSSCQDLHQFLISLRELYMSQALCDVRVRCEDGDISSHRLLLSAGNSPVQSSQ